MPHTKENPLVSIVYKETGQRRVCQYTEDGKIKQEYYSRWLWQRHNGPVTKSFLISYKDGDMMNDDIGNYELISRSDYMRKYAKEHKDGNKYSIRWSKIKGESDLEKLMTVLDKYKIRHFQELHDITGIDLGQLSRIKNKGRGIGLTNIKRLFDALDKI